MILDELTLHNFGVYKGEQKVVLSPTPGRPVILIGGLNGGGKTTFLDALQLVLYGRHARCVGRTKLGYAEYLKRSISRAIPPGIGAGIEVVFRYRSDGRDERFRVLRTWREVGATVKEEVEVHRGEQLDPAATDRWSEFVEQFIPNQISDLFFFDGEKIESLADPERSADLLRVGVHALLGLDLVDDLNQSLLQVERRSKSKLATGTDRDELHPIEQALTLLSERRAGITAEMASVQTQLDRIGTTRTGLEKKFKAAGGDLFERREEVKRALAQHRGRVELVEARLRDLCGGLTPLILVQDLLAEARDTAVREDAARREAGFAVALEERDMSVLSTLAEKGLSERTLRVITSALKDDRNARSSRTASDALLGLFPDRLAVTDTATLSELIDQVYAAVEAYVDACDAVARLEAAEAGIPDDAKVHEVLRELTAIQEEEASLRVRLALFGAEREKVENERVLRERERDRLLEEVAKRYADDEITRRVIKHAARCRATLQSFRQAMRERHVSRLERLVTESFQKLLRKRTLVHNVSIDPETFALHIHGENNIMLPADRLSAGERQLLAVSVLWGLARASGRQLPAVIDTPLGRLDSEHRTYLVSNYFPVASHQVILLSTDEEIEGRYYADLRGAVAREYLISYDEVSHSSLIEQGYFPQSRIAA